MSENQVQRKTYLGNREEQEQAVAEMAPAIHSALRQEIRGQAEPFDVSVSEKMAAVIHLWRACRESLKGNFHCDFAATLKRRWAESAMQQSKDILAAVEALGSSLCPPAFVDAACPADRMGPVGEYIERKVKESDIKADDVLKILRIIKTAAESAEADGRQDYAEWLSEYSGNRPKAISRLRIALDDCIADRSLARRARARLVAAALVAVGIVGSEEKSNEAERVGQTLRENGR